MALLGDIEHEIQIFTIQRERRERASRSPECDAIEMRIRARVLERERELFGTLRGDGHSAERIMTFLCAAARHLDNTNAVTGLSLGATIKRWLPTISQPPIGW